LARETDGLVALSLPLSLPNVARSTHVTDLIEFTDLIEDGLPCRESFAATLEVESEAFLTLLCPATQPTKVRTCPVDIIISSSAGIVDAAPRYGGACAQLQWECDATQGAQSETERIEQPRGSKCLCLLFFLPSLRFRRGRGAIPLGLSLATTGCTGRFIRVTADAGCVAQDRVYVARGVHVEGSARAHIMRGTTRREWQALWYANSATSQALSPCLPCGAVPSSR
jgi:hypothetical protein